MASISYDFHFNVLGLGLMKLFALLGQEEESEEEKHWP